VEPFFSTPRRKSPTLSYMRTLTRPAPLTASSLPPACFTIEPSAMSSPVSSRRCSKPGVFSNAVRRTRLNAPDPMAARESGSFTALGSTDIEKIRRNTVHSASHNSEDET
jgi:hypothetical protein